MLIFEFRLPEKVNINFQYLNYFNRTMEEGALLEPLSVAVHACRRAGVGIGKTVLVCGAGPIGLVCLLTAKAMGATQVIITDISAGRLEVAKSLGADHTVLVGKEDAEVLASQIGSKLGSPPDITIECSGAESSIRLGIFVSLNIFIKSKYLTDVYVVKYFRPPKVEESWSS